MDNLSEFVSQGDKMKTACKIEMMSDTMRGENQTPRNL